MDDILAISDYNSLLALHKAIIEAKFSDNMISIDLPGSPFLAQISNQIIEILIKREIISDENNTSAWKKWREIDNNRREWRVAINYIAYHENVWKTWTRHQKEDFVRILLSPYILDSELLNSFISETDTTISRNSAT